MHDSCDFQPENNNKIEYSDPNNTGVASSETVLAYWDSLGISNGSQVYRLIIKSKLIREEFITQLLALLLMM